MSAIDDVREQLEAMEIVRAFAELESRRREMLREQGYAQYHTVSNKWHRFKRWLRGESVMSEKTWRLIVDAQIDTLPKLG